MLSQIKTACVHAPTRVGFIRIKLGCEIGVHKDTLRALGCPDHIHFWWSESEKALLLSAADEITDMSIAIPPDYYNDMNGLKIPNKQLLKAIQSLLGWEDGTEKKIFGDFVPELNMVVFKTSGKVTEVLASA